MADLATSGRTRPEFSPAARAGLVEDRLEVVLAMVSRALAVGDDLVEVGGHRVPVEVVVVIAASENVTLLVGLGSSDAPIAQTAPG